MTTPVAGQPKPGLRLLGLGNPDDPSKEGPQKPQGPAPKPPAEMSTEELLRYAEEYQRRIGGKKGSQEVPQEAPQDPKPAPTPPPTPPQDAGKNPPAPPKPVTEGPTTRPGGTLSQEQETFRRNLEAAQAGFLALVEKRQESQVKFAAEAQAAQEKQLQDEKTKDDSGLTKYAGTQGDRAITFGIYEEEVNRIRKDAEQLKRENLWSFYDEKVPVTAGVNISIAIDNRWNWGVPGKELKYTDKEEPLMNPGGNGQFENPTTGQLEWINGQIPEPVDTLTTNIDPELQAEVAINWEQDWYNDVWFLGGLARGLLNGARIKGRVGLHFVHASEESGLLPLQITKLGSVQDPVTGDIQGTSELGTDANTTDLTWYYYLRYMSGDMRFVTPLYGGGIEFFGFDPYDPNVDRGVLGNLISQGFKSITAPTFAVGFTLQREPYGAFGDRNKTTFLTPLQEQKSVLVVWKDWGIGYEHIWGKNETKMQFKEGEGERLFITIPWLYLLHSFGVDGRSFLADDFELYANGTPKASVAGLLDQSKIIAGLEWWDWKNPRSNTFLKPPGSDAKPGSITAKANGWFVANEMKFNGEPTGTWFDWILADSKLTCGVQVLDVKVEGVEDQNITIFLPSPGGQGGINTQVSGRILPNASGKWFAVSADFEKLVALGGNGYLVINPYGDYREILGEIEAKIKTFGVRLGYTYGKRFSDGPTDK